jgi:hypothetical protein
MRTIHKAMVVAVSAVLGTGTGIGLAATGDTPSGTAWHPERSDAPVPATAAQKAAFGVLATARRSSESAGLVEGLAEQAPVGLDADGARVVGATARGPIWLVPIAGGLCVGLQDTADGSIGISCDSTAHSVDHGVAGGDGTTIYGVVPDGVDTITVTPDGGTARTVKVSDGGVYALPSEDATVALDGPDGPTTFDLAG